MQTELLIERLDDRCDFRRNAHGRENTPNEHSQFSLPFLRNSLIPGIKMTPFLHVDNEVLVLP